MKLSCLQKNLFSGISIVEKAITKNSTLPILENILLTVEKGRLHFSATNLEIAITSWVGGKIVKTGALTVPAKILSNFVASLPNKKVDLESKGNILQVKCENYKVNIKGLPAKDFPLIPKIKKDPIIKLSPPSFKRALSQVAASAAISESRPELSGVFIKADGQEAKIAATDSYRLSEKKIFLREKTRQEFSLILPGRTAYELIRILGEQEGEVSLCLGDNQILFELNNSQIISRLIDGQFPDYQRIIPEKFKGQAMVNTNNFINNIKIASLFSGQVDEVALSFSGSKLEINSESAEVGNNVSKLPIKLKGAGIKKITLNHKYLLGGLQNILTDEVRLAYNDAHTPVLLTPSSTAKRPKDKDFLYLIMPIKNS